MTPQLFLVGFHLEASLPEVRLAAGWALKVGVWFLPVAGLVLVPEWAILS